MELPENRTRLVWPGKALPDGMAERLLGPGGPFAITTEEVSGSALQVFEQRPRSVIEVLLSGADRFPDRPYLVFPDRTLTFDSVVGAVAHVAAGLKARFGVGQGDRIGIAAANHMEYALLFWAAAALGAITVAFNGWWTGPELAYAARLTEPRVVFADGRRMERMAGIDLDTTLCPLEETVAELEANGAGASLPEVASHECDPMVILFTSGTTGRPKGVPISHRNVIHFALATQLRGAELRARAAATGVEAPPPPPPCALNASPMFHVSGLTCTMVPAPMNGLTLVYPPPGRWQEDVHLALTEQYQVSNWSLVPTQLWRLLDWPDFERYDLTSLRSVGGGSAVWPPQLLRRLEERLPWVRPALGLGYGMTETNGLGTALGGEASFLHPDSVGEPSPTVEVEIRDAKTRHPLAEGEVGEIALHSATMFAGYWRDPVATEAAIEDGWYHTGDLGFHREGFVYLAGRRNDLIIRGGENVSPVEVENRLFEHPAVAEAAVIGVPHETLGQQVKAFLVLKEGRQVTAEEVRSFSAATLAGFKVPEDIEFVDALPHNASGKVLKHLLFGEGSASDFVEE
ncbi:MAG TPA: class I adenylate-forming enzyme family protein [Acidimicrobiales bacterium]|nr:class I adenylate-forming enzyme family protein [Acidimicrobiales bacterium]